MGRSGQPTEDVCSVSKDSQEIDEAIREMGY